MSDSDTVISDFRPLTSEEKRKVREFIFHDCKDDLQKKVGEGLAALERGEKADGEDVFERLRKRPSNSKLKTDRVVGFFQTGGTEPH